MCLSGEASLRLAVCGEAIVPATGPVEKFLCGLNPISSGHRTLCRGCDRASHETEQVPKGHPMKSLAFLIAILCLPALVFAETPEEESTIGRKLEGIEKASTFIQLLKNTDKAKGLLFDPRGETTVFVPTNKAFETMDKASRAKLFDPSNKHWLERVLTYHAVHGNRTDAYVVGRVELLQNGLGQYLTITRTDKGGTLVDGATISEVDLVCSNGIVHFIDEVLAPVELDLFEMLERDGRFTILTKLITRSGLSKLFQNRHTLYSVFAPTDEAFKSLPAGTIEMLLSPEKLDLLSDVIRSHIVEGVHIVGKAPFIQPLGTPGKDVINAYGERLIFRSDKSGATIDERRITEFDLVARNGFLHVIDRPLQPKRESLADRMHDSGKFDVFLSLCKQAGVYDLLGQFNKKITVFAPLDSVFEDASAKKLLAELTKPESTEQLRGILLRHFVSGREIETTNAVSFRRFTSSLEARLDIERFGDTRRVQGVGIVVTDLLARNGIAHGINGIIPAAMEPVDMDQNWHTYRGFVLETLANGSKLYTEGKLRDATDYYAHRNYEFTARYGEELNRLYGIEVRLNPDLDRNFRYEFAETAWRQREAFRNLLREIEKKQPLLIDEIGLRSN
ncbi:MAG: fasciclin domain-containing protein [Chloroflexota bacterium]